MENKKALYVDWHLPRKVRGKNLPLKSPWEIAMIIRSVSYSRKYNGFSPVLYCDSETYNYYDEIGLLKHFDEVKAILPLETNFDAGAFWAAGKFYAILDCDSPFVLIDLDAEIRFKLDFGDSDIYCTHLERIVDQDMKFYPSPAYLDPSNYIASKYGLEWSDKACNTCILAFNDLDFAKGYANAAIDYMNHIGLADGRFSNVSYIVLIEQRFLYELCRSRGKKIGTMISGNYIPTNYALGLPSFEDSDLDEIAAKGFFHVWGFKNDIRKSKDVEDEFFGSLLSSSLDLKDSIIESVSMNHKLYIEK
jgi:hypothetical protein